MKSTLARTLEEHRELERILSNHIDLAVCLNIIFKKRR